MYSVDFRRRTFSSRIELGEVGQHRFAEQSFGRFEDWHRCIVGRAEDGLGVRQPPERHDNPLFCDNRPHEPSDTIASVPFSKWLPAALGGPKRDWIASVEKASAVVRDPTRRLH